MSKDQLFKIEGNYIYFLILFNSITQSNWIIGRPLTLKYPFVFNSDSNNIGLYKKFKKNNSISTNKNYNFKNIILVFIIIILIIGLIIFGIIIGKIIFGIQRKKRANELMDNYEYISENISNKDINKNIKLINNKKDTNNDSSSRSIEMKINI